MEKVKSMAKGGNHRWRDTSGFIYESPFYQASQAYGESGVGYLLIFMEWPWMVVFQGVYAPGTYTGMIFIGVIGTFIYALVGMAIGLLSSEIKREFSRKR